MNMEPADMQAEVARLRQENQRLNLAAEVLREGADQAAATASPSRPAWRLQAMPRLTSFVLAILACGYFLLFVPPNLVGSEDLDMLNMGSGLCDEQGMYQCLTRLREPATSIRGTLGNWLHYEWYYYGYPFFLASGLGTLAVDFLERRGLLEETDRLAAHILVVRQLSSLFIILSVLLLTYAWTGFQSLVRSVFVFGMLVSLPVVFQRNMVWHPDALVTLFVVLTILALTRDALRFGRWFYLAAVFCGLATGTKVTGLFFFLTIAVYLVLGIVKRFRRTPAEISTSKQAGVWFAKYGMLFFVIMVLTVVVSNPLLVRPEIAKEYLTRAKESIQWGNESFVLAQIQGDKPLEVGPLVWYAESFRASCGPWWIYLLILGIWLFSVRYDPCHRLLNILIATWALPLGLYLLFFGFPDRSYYFLPVILPLVSCLGNPSIWMFWTHSGVRRVVALCLLSGVVLLGGIEVLGCLRSDLRYYRSQLYRVEKSRGIAFGRELEDKRLRLVPAGATYRILRDVGLEGTTIYLPQFDRFDVRGFSNYKGVAINEDIHEFKPDLIILRQSNVALYAHPRMVRYYDENPDAETVGGYAADRELYHKIHRFYCDVKNGRLNGYHKVLENDFAIAYEKGQRD
jgi:hypothetical protein